MISRRPALILALALALAGTLGTTACGGRSGPTAVDYSVSAQKNYDRGMAMLEREEWQAAAKYFSFIRSRFPYSKFAVLAELRLADSLFGAEEYLDAAESYRVFAKLHVTHELVANGYTSLRVAESYYKQLPGDMWIVPPSYEKDQTSIEEAAEELDRFLAKFPDSPFRKRGVELRTKVAKRLADHEWYVATYYWDRGKPMGTVLRLRRLLDRYSGVGYDERALWLLGRAYAKVDMPDRARETWAQLVSKYPKSSQAGDAKGAIARLPAATPPKP
ncbi:MAG: outer membrane protein assembly factor BamD [Myxococcales bacterium]|nr:outer membrane protein assembly factor BamD [Myxococcales bacterium]